MPIPNRPFEDFAGQRVAVALNLNQCGPGKPDKPGEHCWSVRAKPSGPVLAYTPYVLLEDVELVVSASGLARVQREGVKSVFAWAVGTAVAQKGAKVPNDWESVGFNPLLPPKGRGETGFKLVNEAGKRRAVETLAWFFGKGRKAVGSNGAARRNPDVKTLDIAAHAPDLFECWECAPRGNPSQSRAARIKHLGYVNGTGDATLEELQETSMLQFKSDAEEDAFNAGVAAGQAEARAKRGDKPKTSRRQIYLLGVAQGSGKATAAQRQYIKGELYLGDEEDQESWDKGVAAGKAQRRGR